MPMCKASRPFTGLISYKQISHKCEFLLRGLLDYKVVSELYLCEVKYTLSCSKCITFHVNKYVCNLLLLIVINIGMNAPLRIELKK